MARKKMTERAAAVVPEGETSGGSQDEGSSPTRQKTQTQMVEDCLNANGWEYKPKKILDWLKIHYNTELKTSQISTIKSTLMRRRGESAGTGGAPLTAPRGGENLSVEELRMVKQLATRMGPTRFRDLVELLCS